jgi:hypothetical protein
VSTEQTEWRALMNTRDHDRDVASLVEKGQRLPQVIHEVGETALESS